MPKGHLTPVERGQIQALLSKNCALAEIAYIVGRCPSVISREIKRNGGSKGYRAERAQRRYMCVRKACKPQKRLDYPPLKRLVIDAIVAGWTPEQIAGRLALAGDMASPLRISHETLYRCIYEDKRLHFLIPYLPQARPKRRRRGQGKSSRGPQIPNRQSIHERPAIVEDRSRFGDWEGDLIVGAGQKAFILTLVERKSRRLLAKKLDSKDAQTVAKAVIELLLEEPRSWVQTITFDNGSEFFHHEKMSAVLKTPVYFADPYASHQRGCNENTNGLLRRYYPKGTDLQDLSQEELDRSLDEINNRPKKCLGYRSPNEVFKEYLQLRPHAFRI